MARRTSLTSLKQISEINLTPLMDLTFILLITFIITFPLLEQGIPIDLPKEQAKDLAPVQSQTVTLDREGRLYLDNTRLSREDLLARLTALRRVTADLTVMVRADEGIAYGDVVGVLRLLTDARVTKLALVTQPAERGSR